MFKFCLKLDNERIFLDNSVSFLKSLEAMLESGFSLPKALNILAAKEKGAFKKAIFDMKEESIRGKALLDSFKSHADVFPRLFQEMIENAKGNDLRKALPILISHIKKESRFRNEIRKYFFRSAVLFSFALASSILAILVIAFAARGVEELPATAQFILSLRGLFGEEGVSFIILIILLCLLTRFKPVKMILDTIASRAPIISVLSAKYNAVIINRHLSSLVPAGIPLGSALETTADSVRNFYYKKILKDLAERTKNGEDFFSAFGFCFGLYPGAVIKSVLKDKKDVAGSLDKLADVFEEEIKSVSKSVSQILEIVLMLLIGSGAAFFFISYFSLLVD
ncbi:MAG: type II secretion system F family protein [Candidatus Paceibacterota bacterium]